MLKKFFFNLLSSFVGAWLAIVFAGVAAVVILMGIFSSAFSGSVQPVEKGSVLQISLEGMLEERETAGQLDVMGLINGEFTPTQSVATLVASIKSASEDDRIRAIYLDCGGIAAAPASLNAVREALIDFKKSKKKIYAYADGMTQGAYFVASVADEISLNPAGNFSMSGLGGESLFYKGLFDKIGVEFQAVRVGKGKAAIEPFTQDTMSSVARQQNMQLLDTLWLQMRKGICQYRKGLTPAKIDTLISTNLIACKPAKFALEQKLVDKLEYRYDFEQRLAKAMDEDNEKLEKVVTPGVVAASDNTFSMNTGASDQIAVVYACGAIDDMMGAGGINSEEMTSLILDLADDDNVQGLVLRVNSPGGSAFGSEQMWHALEVFKKTGKPFAVSMGDYAASGGYYISCGANRIFADAYTLTGSIGIFGLIPNVKGLMDMIGLNAEMVATNPNAIFPTGMKPMDEQQLAAMQSMVEDGYNLFISRVATGRKLSLEKVKEFADGRPLSAVVAKSYGLVDSIGSLADAVDWVGKQAKLKDPAIVAYPQLQPDFMSMLASMQTASVWAEMLHSDNPTQAAAKTLQLLQARIGRGAVMARMQPFEVKM